MACVAARSDRMLAALDGRVERRGARVLGCHAVDEQRYERQYDDGCDARDGEALHACRLPQMITLTDEQQAFVEAIRDFARARVRHARAARRADRDGRAAQPRRSTRGSPSSAGSASAIPEEYGGSGGGVVDLCLFLEETARGLLPVGGFGVDADRRGRRTSASAPRSRSRTILGGDRGGRGRGDRDVRARGRAPTSARCSAAPSGANGGYVVNGQKTWISEAPRAPSTSCSSAAPTRAAASTRGSRCSASRPTPRASRSAPIETMGGREVNDVFFTDCDVPADALVGDEGQGWTQLMAGLNVERLILAAQMLGLAQRAFDDALAYVKEREQFGRPIGSFQALRHRIADLATEIECCAAAHLRRRRASRREPRRAVPARRRRWPSSRPPRSAKQVALEGMQMMGGYGYATEYDMESHVRTRARLHDLRRHQRDPARHHRQDLRALTQGSSFSCAEGRSGSLPGPLLGGPAGLKTSSTSRSSTGPCALPSQRSTTSRPRRVPRTTANALPEPVRIRTRSPLWICAAIPANATCHPRKWRWRASVICPNRVSTSAYGQREVP